MTMDPEPRRRVEEVFLRVLEASAEERAAVLDRECAGDPALRSEVASLLAHDGSGTFIRDLVTDEAAALAEGLERGWIGRRVGAWRITRILGRGGMGAVYEVARDDGAFEQRAAMKIVRAGIDDDLGRRRFLEERQILARLNHPDIARLLDGGQSDDGIPFLVMEAVDGLPIAEHCDRAQLSVEARLRLFVTVCRAVQFAHTQLIVHRDLKPSNILVTADGTVKLLDFGIARLLAVDALDSAAAGELALTPDYASPEQLRGEVTTTVSDVYSLGAVLFELLTGKKAQAFRAQALPPSAVAASQRERKLRGDLDAIVLTALQEDPARRYASAEQLAQDIERHLGGLPVSARADSWRYRAGKFIARNRITVAASTLVVLSLVVGIIGTLWQARRAERRFQQVRSLANTFLFRFHDEIRDLPGSTKARELVASTALEYLDSLAKDAQRDPALQMELGAAYEKVGDVLGNPWDTNVGRTKDALASYEKSLQLRLAASGDAVDTPAEGRAVLKSHLRLADVKMNAGRTDDAARHIETALDLAQRFGTTADRGAVARREGELALKRGDLAKAERAYLASLQAVRQEPDPTSRVSIAGRLGYIYKLASRQEEAMRAFDVALAGAMQLHAAAPDRASHVRQIMNIHNDRADALRSPFAAEGVRLQDALREYEAAMDNAVWLAKADPSAYSARMGVLFAKAQIADTWRELEPARALPLLEDLFAEVAVLRREDPSNFQTQWFEALLRSAWADATRASGARRQALARYDEAVTRIQTMQQTDRGRSISKRDLTKVLADRGALRLSLGDVAGATADAAACRTFADGFAPAKARPLDLRDAASCYELGGDVALRSGRAEEAVRDYDAALARWSELEHRKLTSPFLRDHRASAERRRAEAVTSAAR